MLNPEPSSFNTLNDYSKQLVFRHYNNISDDEKEALSEDILSDSYCNIRKNCKKKADLGNKDAYLVNLSFFRTAIKNKCVDELRRQSKKISIDKISLDNLCFLESSHSTSEDDNLLSSLQNLLKGFPECYPKDVFKNDTEVSVIYLMFYEGKKREYIADKLGKSKKTISNIKWRVINRLKKKLS